MNSSISNKKNVINFTVQLQQNKNRQSQAASPLPSIRKNKNENENTNNQFPTYTLNKSAQNSPARTGNKRSNSSQAKEQNQNGIMFVNQQHQLHRYQQYFHQDNNKKMNSYQHSNRIAKQLFKNDSGKNIENDQHNITYINLNTTCSTNKNQITPASASNQKYRNSSQNNSVINFFKEAHPIHLQSNNNSIHQNNIFVGHAAEGNLNTNRNSNIKGSNLINQNKDYELYLKVCNNNINFQQDDNLFYIQPELDEQGRLLSSNSKESLLDPELFVTNEVSTETKSQITNSSIQHDKTIINDSSPKNELLLKEAQHIQNSQKDESKIQNQQQAKYLAEIQTNQILLDNTNSNSCSNQKIPYTANRLNTRSSSSQAECIPQQLQMLEGQKKKSLNQLIQQHHHQNALNSLKNSRNSSNNNYYNNKQTQNKQQPYIDFLQNPRFEQQYLKNENNIRKIIKNSLVGGDSTQQQNRNVKKFKIERKSMNSNYNNLSDYIENSNIQTLQDLPPQQFEEISSSMPIQTVKKVRSPNNYLSITQQSINSDSFKLGLTPSEVSTNGRSSVNAVYYQRNCNSVNRSSVRNSSMTKARFPSRAASPQNHSFSSTRPNSNTEKAFQKMFRRRNPEHISVNSNNLFEENNDSTARSLNVKLLSIFKQYNSQDINKVLVSKKSFEKYLQSFDPEKDENSKMMQSTIIEYFQKWSDKINNSVVYLKNQLEAFWNENSDFQQRQQVLKRMPIKTQKYYDDCKELCESAQLFYFKTEKKENISQIVKKCQHSLDIINLLNTLPKLYQETESFFINPEQQNNGQKHQFEQLHKQTQFILTTMRSSIQSDEFLSNISKQIKLLQEQSQFAWETYMKYKQWKHDLQNILSQNPAYQIGKVENSQMLEQIKSNLELINQSQFLFEHLGTISNSDQLPEAVKDLAFKFMYEHEEERKKAIINIKLIFQEVITTFEEFLNEKIHLDIQA
ncbi:hypothetical protein ABPG72_018308 [Tetrahymena utriculariae]